MAKENLLKMAEQKLQSAAEKISKDLIATCYKEQQTNADRIRAMSDDELAEWLVKKTKYQESAWSEPSYLNFLTELDDTMESAIKGTVEWLKQPVEGE